MRTAVKSVSLKQQRTTPVWAKGYLTTIIPVHGLYKQGFLKKKS